MTAVDDVLALFAARGGEHHGEVVDQRAHALQCATLARDAGAGDHLVAAALLHDVGHLLGAAETARVDLAVDDDHHEAVGARWTSSRFGGRVARPIALHVVAKRYRWTVDPEYLAALSPTSVLTLRAQGGPLDRAGVVRFERHPAHADALALRDWDEAAKDPRRVTDAIEAFLPLLVRLLVNSGRPTGVGGAA